MAKFKKKPIIIETEQFVIWDFKKVPDYVEIFGTCFAVKGKLYDRYIEIPSTYGILRIDVNDYIIKGIDGEFYPCSEDVFQKTYEKVKE